jgi:hypothetical protein
MQAEPVESDDVKLNDEGDELKAVEKRKNLTKD